MLASGQLYGRPFDAYGSWSWRRSAARRCSSPVCCASPRQICSRQASLRDTGRPRCPPPSESTPHEPGQPHSPLLSRSVPLVQDRPPQRSSEPTPRKARIGLGPLLPGHPSPVATTAAPRPLRPPRHQRPHPHQPCRNPHRACGTAAAHIPRVPSRKAFGRRPRCPWIGPSWGRHPKPSTILRIR
jgi:hypothetical protein